MLTPGYNIYSRLLLPRRTFTDVRTFNIASVVYVPPLWGHSGLLLAVLLVIVINSGRSLAANPFAEGEQWLKWSDETRLAYVSAYQWGHARGFRDGCQAGERIYSHEKSKGLPGERCIPEHPNYSKKLEDYAGMITRFYSSYPDDVNVPIFKLLDAMSDSKHLTIQQMHQYYGGMR